MRHVLDLSDAGGDAIAAMINDAQDRKAARLGWAKGRPDADAPLAGRVERVGRRDVGEPAARRRELVPGVVEREVALRVL